jgi:hypothetical protein
MSDFNNIHSGLLQHTADQSPRRFERRDRLVPLLDLMRNCWLILVLRVEARSEDAGRHVDVDGDVVE